MEDSLPERVELRRWIHVHSRGQRRRGWILQILSTLLVVIVAVMIYREMSVLGLDWVRLFRHAWENFAKRPLPGPGTGHVLALVALAFYIFRAKRYERLILTPEGLSYRSPMPGFLQRIQASWSLRWDQIRTATLTVTPMRIGAQGPILVLEGAGRKHRIAPLMWVDPVQYAEAAPVNTWWRLTGRRPSTIDAAVDESPVMRYIARSAPTLKIRRGTSIPGASFSLERSPQALIVIVAFFAFAAYALIDGVILRSEVYASSPLYPTYIMVAILVSVLTGVWLRRSSVPLLESTTLALLLGAAVGAAAYPGALRINAMTDTAGLHSYEYVCTADGRYRPTRRNLPSLSFSGNDEYWAQFAPGSAYEFQLRKGGLGFYQLSMRPVEAAIRAYYSHHR